MPKEKYTEEELYEMLWDKAEEIEKVPTAREINSDPFLPNFEVFTDCFGQFRDSEKLEEMVEKFTLLNKKNKCFCHDCYSKKCSGDFESCKGSKLAKLYFTLFDTIIH